MTIYHLIISYILFFSVCLGQDIPFWVKHPPKHNDYLYGVGISNRFVDDQDSFSEAKIGAVENISRQFQVQIIAGLARVSSGSVSSSEYFTHQIIDSTSYRRINNNMIVIDSILTNDNALILSIINKDLSMPSIDKIQHNPNMDEGWLPKNKKLIYKSYEGGEASSNSSSDTKIVQCHWPWSGIVVNPDGGINPCCIIDDPKSDFHNLNGKKISEIWNSKEYISSRSEFSDKSEIHKNTICNVCKNQTHSKRLSRVSKTFAIKL